MKTNDVFSADRIINPIIPTSLPDPTVIRTDDGIFYLYATEDIRNIPIYQSIDMVEWRFIGTVFTDDTRPTFFQNGHLWAPDINFINDKYVLYYALSKWGERHLNGIGVAVADHPWGPFTDKGKLFTSDEIGVENSIDPFFFEEDGHNYLFWGSFHGIYGIELAHDGQSVKRGAEKKQIAGSLIEGTCIVKHGEWYFLIGSAGTCCSGLNSTYHVVVARSENLFGPYKDKNGRSALSNGFSMLLQGTDYFVGPGHNSEFVEDEVGENWVFYHSYINDEMSSGGRQLCLAQVYWEEDGWPYFGDVPADISYYTPVLNYWEWEELHIPSFEESEKPSFPIMIEIGRNIYQISTSCSAPYRWEVIYANGRNVLSSKTFCDMFIDLNPFPKGMYIFVLQKDGKMCSNKFYKE